MFFVIVVVQLLTVVIHVRSLQPHGLQHSRLLCPSLSPGVCLNSLFLESVMLSNHLILCCPILLMCFLPHTHTHTHTHTKASFSDTCEPFSLTQLPNKTQMPIEEHAFYLQNLIIWCSKCRPKTASDLWTIFTYFK